MHIYSKLYLPSHDTDKSFTVYIMVMTLICITTTEDPHCCVGKHTCGKTCEEGIFSKRGCISVSLHSSIHAPKMVYSIYIILHDGTELAVHVH